LHVNCTEGSNVHEAARPRLGDCRPDLGFRIGAGDGESNPHYQLGNLCRPGFYRA
jgi:hypothetical protein